MKRYATCPACGMPCILISDLAQRGPTRCSCANENCCATLAYEEKGEADMVGTGVKMDMSKDINKRGSILLDAHTVINGERQDVYGSPEDSFALIAGYWNQYLVSVADKTDGKHAIAASDVAMMMVLFKIAREANQHKPDNICDACGYLGIYADMQDVTND